MPSGWSPAVSLLFWPIISSEATGLPRLLVRLCASLSGRPSMLLLERQGWANYLGDFGVWDEALSFQLVVSVYGLGAGLKKFSVFVPSSGRVRRKRQEIAQYTVRKPLRFKRFQMQPVKHQQDT
ncbi:hypothetical protein CC78DRAFT_574378 [Lojkania enalia]|uniref:Secreted protein n=1 Tax=Lojkania enalia TaxID=147567 RepID=A0A9P4NBL1_9PLEO|nr:hypothetical protein CC78DRAFT_574378 [Didymosphaeria enalia]